MFIYLTVNSAVFYCERKPQCCSSLRSGGKRWATTVVHSLSVYGGQGVILFLPRAKETLEDAWRRLFSPKCCDVWSVMRIPLDVFYGHLGLPFPGGFIWLVFSHMGHFEGKLSLSPLYHWDKVLAKYGSD